MQIVRSLYRCAVVIVFGICAVGLLAITTSAQNAFNGGSTGADGALVFYAPPPSRHGHAMVYDAGRQRVVLFGGRTIDFGSTFNDTWEYDGTTWMQRTPATAPSGRARHAMAYDSTHQVTVLFGGTTNFGSILNDTWLWNGTTWSAPVQVQPSVVIDMNTRPDGIWHYTTIDIPAGTTVSFKSNAANTPVIWLATGPVYISGEINLDGAPGAATVDPGNEAPGGPGGGAGGLGGRRFDVSGSYAGTAGQGPGGGYRAPRQGNSEDRAAMERQVGLGRQVQTRSGVQYMVTAWYGRWLAALAGEVARRRIQETVATGWAVGGQSSSRHLIRSRLVAVFTRTGAATRTVT
jgi:hypothetical protein